METTVAKLTNLLRTYNKIGIAFSGGVDSTLLLKAAVEAIGTEGVFAYTVKSPYIPQWSMKKP